MTALSRTGLLLAALCALPSAGAAQSAGPAAPVTLRPGDAVRITVWRNEELSGEFQVGENGTLVHPLYRSVRVAGIPLTDVEARLKTFLERWQTQPEFVVQPLLRVSVGGEVERPALYYFGPDVKVSQVVALAGGPTERGRRDRVRIMVDGRVRQVRLDGSDPAAEQPIRSGEQYIVERRGSVFRDVVAPVIGIAGSIAAIVGVATRRGL